MRQKPTRTEAGMQAKTTENLMNEQDATAGKPKRLSTFTAALALALFGLASAIGASPAAAEVEWSSEAYHAPTHLEPGEQGMVRIFSSNVGDSTSSDFPSVSFELPPGVTFSSVSTSDFWLNCSPAGTPQTVTCTSIFSLSGLPVGPERYIGPPGSQSSQVQAVVDVSPSAPEATYEDLEIVVSNSDDTTTDTYELTVSSDQLGFGPTAGTFTAGAFDDSEPRQDFTQAGGHPYEATASFELNTKFREPDNTTSDYARAIIGAEAVKDIVVDLPRGFVGDPSAVPECRGLGAVKNFSCPASAQVGVAEVAPPMQGFDGRRRMFGVYNVEPPAGAPAQFAFQAPVGTVALTPVLRSDGDLGLSVQVRGVTQADDSATILARTTLWGQPAHSSHFAQRCANPSGVTKTCTGFDEAGSPLSGSSPQVSNAPLKPFLTNPTRCTGQKDITRLHVASWEDPGQFNSFGDPDLSDPNWKTATATAPPLTGCDRLQFNPTLGSQPTSTSPDSPTGLDFRLGIPQNEDPNGLATAHLEDTTVVLPEEMTVNPSSANGLEACSSDQIGLTSPVGAGDPQFNKEDPLDGSAPDCPLSSKIGTVEVDTPLLDDPLSGEVFLAAQGDHPFDSLVAIYLVIRGPGLIVKLAGEVEPDPETGQLTTTVTENPQLPFEELTLDLKSGSRAPLTVPSTCGEYRTTSRYTSWAGHDVSRRDAFQVTGQCSESLAERPFDASMQAGSRSPFAGESSPFVLRITRPDGSQELESIRLSTPEGLSANLSGIPYCSESGIARADNRDEAGDGALEEQDPSCPEASRVGRTLIGAGVGPDPYYASGDVYLAGPHEGAPLSLAFIVAAKAGPFDLGVQVVRTALHVNPRTAEITAISDEIPKILEGIPLKIQDVRVALDREDFTLNPTSCKQMAIQGAIAGSNGARADLQSPFQVGGCADLSFNPRFGMRILNRGRRSTVRSFNPATRFTVVPREGEANIDRAAVALPRGIILDQSNIGTTCTRDQLAARECPDRSLMGFARAWSPLLDEPVMGPVYLGSSDNLLPDLVADLQGQVDILLRGRIDSTRDNRIRNVFEVVPDVAVSRFTLQMAGGQNRGILVNSTDLCRADTRGVAVFRGQNGKRQFSRPPLRLGFRRCRQVRRQIARRQAVRKAALRKAVRAGEITPATARRAIRS